MSSKYAVCTLVMNGDKYVPGAVCLAKSVRMFVPPQFLERLEIVCMVTDDVPTEDLVLNFDRVIEVERIRVQNPPQVGGNKANGIYSWNSDAPTKWNILGLDQYKKVLFLDADMIVVGDISPLFDTRTPAAVFDHQTACEYVGDERWTGTRDGRGFTNWYKVALGLEDAQSGLLPGSDTYGHMTTGTLIPRDSIAKLRTRSNCQFALQGGLVLIEPKKEHLILFKESVQSLSDSLCKTVYSPSSRRSESVRTERTLSAIDEITLSLFYHEQGYTWTHIDIQYNVSAYHLYTLIPKDQIRIIHFITTYKPWNTRPDGVSEREYIRRASNSPYRNAGYKSHHETVEKWWEIYDS